MNYQITPNDEGQCYDVRITHVVTGRTEAHHVSTADLLDWLRRILVTDHLAKLSIDTAAVDTPEPRYTMAAGSGSSWDDPTWRDGV